MVNDTISDLLTRIRNANLIKSQTVSIPLTRINQQITEILEKQGFIDSFQIFPCSSSQVIRNRSLNFETSEEEKKKQTNHVYKKKKNKSQINDSVRQIILYLKYKGPEKKPCITNLKRISKPGLRIYTTHKDIPKILGGMGIAILSTSNGVLTDREARFYKIGGEILCSIW